LNAIADRFCITKIAVAYAPDPVINPQTSLSIPQAIEPIAKNIRFEDAHYLSFIWDIFGFVNFVFHLAL